MRKTLIAPLAALIVLAGCSSEPAGPKSEEEVRAAAAQMAKPQPGKYRSTSKLISLEIPGVPENQVAGFRKMFESTQQGTEYCLTAAEAEKGFEEAMKKLPQGKCKYDRFTVSGNTLDAKLSCETGKGMTAAIEMNGTISGTSTRMTMSVDQKAPGMPGGGMKMKAEVASERIGDCEGA